MNDGLETPLSLVGLQAHLQAVDPAALLVPSRMLRRIIKQDHQVPGLGLLVPHRKSYVLARDRLLQLVDREELGLTANQELPTQVILIAQPSTRRLASTSNHALLIMYWRLLFHASVHRSLEERRARGTLNEEAVRKRIEGIGQTQFAEIRSVLQQEKYLLAPDDDALVYVEFVAVYLELRYFASDLLPRFFPAFDRWERVDAVLAADLDGERLFAATRPEGTPHPSELKEQAHAVRTESEGEDKEQRAGRKPSVWWFHYLIRRAKQAAARGNLVRAAVSRLRAASVAPAGRRKEMRESAQAIRSRLSERLRDALGLASGDHAALDEALAKLLEPAARGFWPVEARLLYDLQKVCLDHEREVFAIDLLGWLFTLGKRPLKRPLPNQREVLMLKHLRGAVRRVPSARVADRYRQTLLRILQASVHHCERQFRAQCRPALQNTLAEVGFRPENLPERIAGNKLIEELLDRINERGFLNLSDLRDAVSRNRLKLPDLASPREFLGGDRLLLANRRLTRELDGIYRRGEIYLRWLQRFSSLAFGTRPGRFLTRYLILPYGSAFVALAGLQHLVEHLVKSDAGAGIHLESAGPVLVLGTVLLGLIHVPAFRDYVLRSLKLFYQCARRLVIDLPLWLVELPVVRRVLDSPPVILGWRFVLKPFALAAPVGAVAHGGGLDRERSLWLTGAVFAAATVLLNTRLGRDLEEAITDWSIQSWKRFHSDFLPSVFRWVMGSFRRCVESIDRFLYNVDEWLRFQSGETRLTLGFKAILGLFWASVMYVVRFCINLLIEPQVNPIKHFPVVTVSHKLVLALFVPPLTHVLSLTMDAALAGTIAFTVGAMIPGVFGFLVWEFKENWRLYRANQSPTLDPIMIGHHGETMLQFLKPGFHSGTIPKLFAKLRRAAAASETEDGKAAEKHLEALHHVEESLRHFLERELVALLKESRRWRQINLSVGPIHLSTKRICLTLEARELGEGSTEVVFAEQDGWLVADISGEGWLPRLTGEQTAAFSHALIGLYKWAGVDVVRGRLPDWSGPSTGSEELLPIKGESPFRDVPVAWTTWVDLWERDQNMAVIDKKP